MFLYNIRVNSNRLLKFMFITMLIIILVIFSIGVYNVFFKHSSSNEDKPITLTDTIKSDEIFEITEKNYTNILKAVTEDIDSYIGCKIHFTGYVYRLLDFDNDQFVLARKMLISKEDNQGLVVGFLCSYNDANNFSDNTWVDVTGEIVKGDYYGDIAVIKVTCMFETNEPENKYVLPPDNSYIPTSSIL